MIIIKKIARLQRYLPIYKEMYLAYLVLFFSLLVSLSADAGTYNIRCKNSHSDGVLIKTFPINATKSQLDFVHNKFRTSPYKEEIAQEYRTVNKKLTLVKEKLYPCEAYDRFSGLSDAVINANTNCHSNHNPAHTSISGNDLLQHISILGDNDIWEAPDNLKCLPWAFNPKTKKCGAKVNAQLSNIIQRVGLTYVDGARASALVIGRNCDRIASTKHGLNYDDGSMIGADVGQTAKFFRNAYEDNIRLSEQKAGTSYIQHGKMQPWTVATDFKVSKLKKNVKDQTLSICPPIPVITAKKLKRNYKIKNCVLISYPSDYRNSDAQKRLLMTMKTHTGLKEVRAGTRSITPCTFTGHGPKGSLLVNCDNLGGSSGGPMVCKQGGLWKLAGIIAKSRCIKDAGYNECYNPAFKGKKILKGTHSGIITPLSDGILGTLNKYNK